MHKHQGFTLIEVMVSLLIIGMIMVPVWGLQGTIITAVSDFRDRLARIWFAEHTLYQARRAQPLDASQFSFKNQMQTPNSTITYELKKVAQNSSLAKQHRLFVEKIVAQGTSKRNQEVMISFIYKPEQSQ